MVVSVREKAQGMRQVSIGETSESEPIDEASKMITDDVETRVQN